MLEDEGEEIAGLLVGLNVIDCNMAIKDKDLDQPVSGHSGHSLTSGWRCLQYWSVICCPS